MHVGNFHEKKTLLNFAIVKFIYKKNNVCTLKIFNKKQQRVHIEICTLDKIERRILHRQEHEATLSQTQQHLTELCEF